MANYSVGIDLIADPTGSTGLANHIFISATDGDDVSGDGSPDNPYQSLTRAFNQHQGSTSRVFVLYEGEYTDFDRSYSSGHLKGDGNVQFVGTGSEKVMVSGSSTTYEGLSFVRCTPSQDYRSTTVKYCTFIDTPEIRNYHDGSRVEYDYCLFINSSIRDRNVSAASGSGSVVQRSIFINSKLHQYPGSLGKLTASSCYFDIFSEFHSELAGELSYCNFRGQKSGSFTENSSINVPPLFNNEGGGDFTLQVDSPHIGAGYMGDTIGGTAVASRSYYQGIADLDAAVASNPDVSYSLLGEIENNSLTVQDIDLPEVVFAYAKYLGVFHPSGFGSPDKLKLLISWAMSDGVYGAYKPFRFGEYPLIDTNGLSNGEVGFERGNSAKVIANMYKIRIQILPT